MKNMLGANEDAEFTFETKQFISDNNATETISETVAQEMYKTKPKAVSLWN